MFRTQTIEIGGARLVVMTERDYADLTKAAGRASVDDGLPTFPKADKDGNIPALEYGRVSIARDIIRERRELGLSQQDLADLAGVRQETISRLETGKHSAGVATIEKIERAFKKAAKAKAR
ncbi:MAG: helix-turn-helix transcriptional regulator [Phycisphaeraceae bacterium]|nr:helix-turn-helix transcriptional regulator [Phycisphaerae bacterium]MBX3391115.1 helix-turn-helix transcriptional regulator [Phycisphaeraceae bacterium]HRJ49840.1 helix-turn-helix transcriptional regulator [Phycisphaerales bacterium]